MQDDCIPRYSSCSYPLSPPYKQQSHANNTLGTSVTICNEQDKNLYFPLLFPEEMAADEVPSLEVERGGMRKTPLLLTFRTGAARTIPLQKIENTYVLLTFCVRGRRK